MYVLSYSYDSATLVYYVNTNYISKLIKIHQTIIQTKKNLTHYAGILLSHPGVGYLYPPPPCYACANVIPNPNYFVMTTTTQHNKLPVSTIIFRTTDNTIYLITTNA